MSLLKMMVSSTCYDMVDLRAQIKSHFKQMHYDVVVSNFNDVFFNPNEHTHTSCIKAVEEIDILVLIIGGRYGGNAVPQAIDITELELNSISNPTFLKNLKNGTVSITQLETLKALEKKIPVLTFIRDNVLSDHNSYEKNKKSPYFSEFNFPNIEKQNTVPYIFEFFNYVRLRSYNNAYTEFKDSQDLIEKLEVQLSYLFQNLLKEHRSKIEIKSESIKAQIVRHTSKERTDAFREIFKDIDVDDKIKILGTGVSSFLRNDEEVEEFLINRNHIQILLVNDGIIKKNWACTSKEFLEKLNIAVETNEEALFSELKVKTYCPLASLNFLVDTQHFNKYYDREKYIEKVLDSYELIKGYKEKIKANNWEGKIEAKHFNSFVPLSITAVFPDHSNQRKLLAEFIIPFTENRIMLKSSLEENPEIYKVFIDFFDQTWDRAVNINM